MKTSTDGNTRLMVAVMQQQLREVGIALDIRTFEFATFFADVTHGAFQLYSLRWIGGNEDPDIFDMPFTPQTSRPTEPTAATIRTRKSMRSSTRPAAKSIRKNASHSTLNCN